MNEHYPKMLMDLDYPWQNWSTALYSIICQTDS